MGNSKNSLVILGVLIALLGLAGLVIPTFTTQKTNNVAAIGDLKIQTQENTPHEIPPLLAGGALGLGVILIAGGLYRRA